MSEQIPNTAPDPVADREAWLKERQHFLGATDIAAIMGRNPWKTPLQVYLEKTGIIEPEPPGPAAMRGIKLEPYIATIYTQETGEVVRKARFARRDGTQSYLAASPDYQRVSDGRLVEIKSHSPKLAREYGPAGTDQVPERELLQVTWQMHMTGLCGGADLIALFGVDDVRIFTVPYVPEIAEAMQEAAVRFWEDHVAPRVPPEPTAGDSETINRLFPDNSDRHVQADGDIEDTIDRLHATRQALADMERVEDECIARIKFFMGDAETLHSRAGLFNYKVRAASPRWKDIAQELGATPDDVARHTPAVGPRVFTVPWKKERVGA